MQMEWYIKKIRAFWQKPRKAGVDQHDRHVTFLELFYDVVYVAIISEITHALAYHMTSQGLRHFIFLFTIVWWAWFNGTIYHDLHGNNDLRTRILTFLQMLAIVPMAIYAHHAIGYDSKPFALCYAAFEFILTIMWWRTGVHDKNHRPISYPIAMAFLINTILFTISAFVDESLRYYFWSSGLIVALMLPIYLYGISHKSIQLKRQVSYITGVSTSLVERFGLFTIIVLGEIIIGVVHSAAEREHSTLFTAPMVIGTLTAIGVWRIYFDFISHRKPRGSVKHFAIWYYLHLPLTIGISIMGATMLHVVKYINEPLPKTMQIIFTIGTAMFLLCSAILIPIIIQKDHSERYYKTASRVLYFSAAAEITIGFFPINIIQLLGITISLFVLPFICTTYIWWNEVCISKTSNNIDNSKKE